VTLRSPNLPALASVNRICVSLALANPICSSVFVVPVKMPTLCFQYLPHSSKFAMPPNNISFLALRTLCEKHPGWGSTLATHHSSLATSFVTPKESNSCTHSYHNLPPNRLRITLLQETPGVGVRLSFPEFPFRGTRESFSVAASLRHARKPRGLATTTSRSPATSPPPAAFIRPIPSFVTFCGTMASTKRMLSATTSRSSFARTLGFRHCSSQPVLQP
jgi:hypothetical protein